MPKTLTHIPRVMVIQETSVQPGRDKLRGIFNYAHLYGPWHLKLIHGRSGEQKPASPAELNSYNGIIAGQMMLGLAAALERTRSPIVLMDPLDEVLSPSTPFAHLSRTLDDSEEVGKAGAEYFLGRGYKHFAYVGESLNRNWSALRGTGFQTRLSEAGFTCRIYPGVTSPKKDQDEHLAAWLTSLPKPVALLAAMDTRALHVLDLCAGLGLAVPHEVAVLGVDNDELLCNGSIPTLSSIRRDTERCGFMAARMLDRLMRKEIRKCEIMRYGVREIVTRDSTQPRRAAADPIVHRACEFIRVNAGEPLNIPDVVTHLRVSRRLAETRFRAVCGRTILDEIQAVRLERVARLLQETDLPLTEICTRCGYRTDVHLRRVFKRRFGVTMREYRSGRRDLSHLSFSHDDPATSPALTES